MGAVFAPTRFSLVRISIRDLVADGKSLVRNSGVGGGGENLIHIEIAQLRGLRFTAKVLRIDAQGNSWMDCDHGICLIDRLQKKKKVLCSQSS